MKKMLVLATSALMLVACSENLGMKSRVQSIIRHSKVSAFICIRMVTPKLHRSTVQL